MINLISLISLGDNLVLILKSASLSNDSRLEGVSGLSETSDVHSWSKNKQILSKYQAGKQISYLFWDTHRYCKIKAE